MSSVKKFAHVNAKAKGMYHKCLTYDDYLDLVKQGNLEGVFVRLKENFETLQDTSDVKPTREMMEKFLRENLMEDVNKLARLLDQHSIQILKQYMEKYKIEYMKDKYMSFMMGKKQGINQIKNLKELYQEINELDSCKNLQEFFDFIRDTKYEPIFEKHNSDYFEPETKSLFDLENELEKMYYVNLYKYLKKEREDAVLHLVSKQIDLSNVLWIYRGQTYYHFSSEMRDHMIPVSIGLTEEAIEKLLSGQSYEDVLQHSMYQNVLQEEGDLEEKIKRYLYALYRREFKTDVFSMLMVITYVELKEQQIKNIINIVEGIRYDRNRQEILRKVIV